MHRKQVVRFASNKQLILESTLRQIEQATRDLNALKLKMIRRVSDFLYQGKEAIDRAHFPSSLKQLQNQIAEINRICKKEKLTLHNQLLQLDIKWLSLEIRVAADAGLPSVNIDQTHKARIITIFKAVQSDKFSCAGDVQCQEELFYFLELYSYYSKKTSGRLNIVDLIKNLLKKCDDSFIQVRLLGWFMHESMESSRAKVFMSNTNHLTLLDSAIKKISNSLGDHNSYSAIPLRQRIALIYANMINYEYQYLHCFILSSAKHKKPFKVTLLAGEEEKNLFDSNIPILDDATSEDVLIALLKKDEALRSHYQETLKILGSITAQDFPSDHELYHLAAKVVHHVNHYSETQAGMLGEMLDRFNLQEIALKLTTAKTLFEQVKAWQSIADQCWKFSKFENEYYYVAFKPVLDKAEPNARENERLEDEMIDCIFEKELIRDFFSQRVNGKLKQIENTSHPKITLNEIESKLQLLSEDNRQIAIDFMKDKHRQMRFMRKYFERFKTIITRNALDEFEFGWNRLIVQADETYLELINREKKLSDRRDRLREMKKVNENSTSLPHVEEVGHETSDVESPLPGPVKSDVLLLMEAYDKESLVLAKTLFKSSHDVLNILRIRSKTKQYLPPSLMQIFDEQRKANLQSFEKLISLYYVYKSLADSADEPDMKVGIHFSLRELEELIEKFRKQMDETDRLMKHINKKIEVEFQQFLQQKGQEIALEEQLANLTYEEIMKLGWKGFIEMGRARTEEGLPKSNRSLERVYFRNSAKHQSDTLAMLKFKLPNRAFTEVLAGNSSSSTSPSFPTACLTVHYPLYIIDYFYQFQTLPVFLCGSTLSKLILELFGVVISESTFTDLDFVTPSSNMGDALTIDNRFRVSQFKPLLCKLKDGDIQLDLYFTSRDSIKLPFNLWLRKNASNRHFTAFSLMSDGVGNVYDPTGRGLSDLLARRLSTVNDPKQVLADDPVCVLIAISKMMEGFKPDGKLTEALDGFQYVTSEKRGHLNAKMKEYFGHFDVRERIKFVELLMQFGLLVKIFGVVAKNSSDASKLLSRILKMESQPRLFANGGLSSSSGELEKNREFKF